MEAIPIVMAYLGTLWTPKNELAASLLVILSNVINLVRDLIELYGSLKLNNYNMIYTQYDRFVLFLKVIYQCPQHQLFSVHIIYNTLLLIP